MVKLTQEQFDYVKETYEEIVIKGILNNERLRKSYRLLQNLSDDDLVHIRYARKYIFNFFQNNYPYQIIDEEETEQEDNETEEEENQEDETLELDNEELETEQIGLLKPQEELQRLEDELEYTESIEVTEENKKELTNHKRSLKMKINHLKKKLEE